MPHSDTEQTTENLSFWLFIVKSSFTYRLTFAAQWRRAGSASCPCHLDKWLCSLLLALHVELWLVWKCFYNKDHVGQGSTNPGVWVFALCSRGTWKQQDAYTMRSWQEVGPNRSPKHEDLGRKIFYQSVHEYSHIPRTHTTHMHIQKGGSAMLRRHWSSFGGSVPCRQSTFHTRSVQGPESVTLWFPSKVPTNWAAAAPENVCSAPPKARDILL